jgi:hypothetical protein
VNNLPSGPVLPGMRIHRQHSLPEPPAGRADHTANGQSRRLRWRPRRRPDRGDALRAPESDTGGDQAAAVQVQAPSVQAVPVQAVPVQAVPVQAAPVQGVPGESMAAGMQLAIALLTAGLDSPELEAWAVDTLTPVDVDGLGDFMAGLHVISVVLLSELHEATGEPPAAILQRLAIVAERRRGTPSAG